MKTVAITDHAVIRYLERAKGVDVEAVREMIRDIVGDAAAAGASKITSDGLTFMIVDGRVTTVVPAGSPGAARNGALVARGVSGPKKPKSRREHQKLLRRGTYP